MRLLKQVYKTTKALWRGGMLASLLLLGGCSAAFDLEEISDIFRINKAACWPCTMYKSIWEAVGDLVTSHFPVMCSNALILLGYGLLFWITFTVGKLVVSLKEPNLKDFIGNMATVLFKAFCVSIVLSFTEYTLFFLDTFVTPTLSGFVDLTRILMFSNPTIAKNLAAAPSEMGEIVSSSAIFTSNIGNQIQDLIYRIYLGFHSGMVLGGRMLISPDPTFNAMGFIIIFMFFFLMLTIPLLFIEAFVFLGVIIMLFPFILVAYVFPSTKHFVKPCWNVLFVCMAQILLTGVFMSVMVTVIKSYSDDAFSIGKQLTDPVLLLGLKNMQNELLAFFALSFIMFKMSSEIPNISSRLVGDFNKSKMSTAIQQTFKIGTTLGMFLGGAAMAGSGVGTGVGLAMMNQSTKKLQEVARKGDVGDGAGAGDNISGLSDAQKAAMQGQGGK